MNQSLPLKDVILDKYLQELKDLIKDDGQNIIEDKYYEYKIEKWNNFSNNRLRKYVYPDSKTWRLCFHLINCPQDQQNYISFCLKDYSVREGHPPYNANIVMVFRNVEDMSCFKSKLITPKKICFNSNNNILYYQKFIKESELFLQNDSHHSLVENNKMMVGFYVRYYQCDQKVPEENLLNQYYYQLFYNNSLINQFSESIIDKAVEDNSYDEKECLINRDSQYCSLKEIVVQNDYDMRLAMKYTRENKNSENANNGNRLYNYTILTIIIIFYYYYYSYFYHLIGLIKNN